MKLDITLRKMTPLQRAMIIAEKVHAGQERKFGGGPYINHPRRVAEAQITNLHREVAWLHDVIEDSPKDDPLTSEDLLAIGVDPIVVKTVMALTRRPGQNYFDYIMQVADNPIAKPVKAADLVDNIQDLEEGSMKDKYRLCYFVLTAHRIPERGDAN